MSRRRIGIVLGATIVLVLAVAGGITVVVTHTEKARECTIEDFQEIHKRKALDYVIVQTTECGDIRATPDQRLDVVNPDCPYDTAQVGGRYKMTTVGFEPLFWLLEQRLVGAMVVVEAAPGAVCLSDSWLTED